MNITMPKKLEEIIQQAPIAWGIIALIDYKGGKSVREIEKEWNAVKHLYSQPNPATRG